jgi:hypothetical protein
MPQILTIVSRYSITLFVSLNNRIYFRDHPSSGVHIMNDHVHVVESGPSPHHFSSVGSITHTTTLNESYILHTINLEKGNSDSGTVIDTLSDPRYCILPPQLPCVPNVLKRPCLSAIQNDALVRSNEGNACVGG